MRYLICFAPSSAHPLGSVGREWLAHFPLHQPIGQHAQTDDDDEDRPLPGGLHAVLKPLMRLRPGRSERDLLDATERLASRTPVFTLPPLKVATLAGRIVLQPAQRVASAHPLRRLADACVSELDPFRAPPTLIERARRWCQPGRALDGEQRTLLERWGYPHVFHHWRFMLMLTAPLPRPLRQPRLTAARVHFSVVLQQQLVAQEIVVCAETMPRTPLEVIARFGLDSG